MAEKSTLYRYKKQERKKEKNGEVNKRGRPPKLTEEHKKLVTNLASIFCTTQEIAMALEVSRETIEKNFSFELEKGKEMGKTSLRKAQFKAAIEGNVTMQIWLGKIILHQFPPKDGLVIDEEDTNFLMDLTRNPLNN